MIVRVFQYVGTPDEEYIGEDFEFETMPQVGHVIRATEHDDAKVERVGFIQDGERFVAAVWLEKVEPPKPNILDLI